MYRAELFYYEEDRKVVDDRFDFDASDDVRARQAMEEWLASRGALLDRATDIRLTKGDAILYERTLGTI